MRENLSRRNGAEKFPINRDQTPGGETGDCSNEPGSFVRFFGSFALAKGRVRPSGGQDRHRRTLSVVEALVPSACFFSSAFDTNAATTFRVLRRPVTFVRLESRATHTQRNLHAAYRRSG